MINKIFFSGSEEHIYRITPDDLVFYSDDEHVKVIPLNDIYMIETTEDMSKYGFERIKENIWGNLKYKGELWK